MLIVLIACGYAGLLTLLVCVLTVAKRADEEMTRRPEGHDGRVHALPAHPSLVRIAATIHHAMDAERVVIALADPVDGVTGTIAACVGTPALLGNHIRIGVRPLAGAIRASEAEAIGLGAEEQRMTPWTYAHVPLTADEDVLGAVIVARPWRTFTAEDVARIEQLANSGGRRFDRRRRGATATA